MCVKEQNLIWEQGDFICYTRPNVGKLSCGVVRMTLLYIQGIFPL